MESIGEGVVECSHHVAVSEFESDLQRFPRQSHGLMRIGDDGGEVVQHSDSLRWLGGVDECGAQVAFSLVTRCQ